VDAALHHVLLVLAVLALGDGALRVAALACPDGLERALATAVIATAAAVCMALALGLLGLGTDTAALCIATALVWLAARATLPAPALSPVAEFGRWWDGQGTPARVAVGALGGVVIAWAIWQLRHPSIGFDGSVYHYAEVAGWVANGRPGSILLLSYDLPYGNYPLTDEVVLAWAAGIARSWVPLSLWNPFMWVMLVLASVATLRNLGVPRLGIGLAIVALAGSPVVIRQLNEPQTDLPTLAWLACTAALASGAGRRPALLPVAVVAGGLSIGTKTTAAGMVLVALALGAVLARGQLRRLAPWVVGALAVATAVGGVWYLRNLIDHGSPVWPFNTGPFGDARPHFLTLIDTSFAQRPLETLDGRLGAYTARLGGTWLLLAGGVAVLAMGALARDRLRMTLLGAGGVALIGLLLWSIAPGTGEQTPAQLLGADWPISTARYVLPAAFAAMVALALATRLPGWLGRIATLLLAAAATWSVVATARVPFPWTPSIPVLLAGAAAGALPAFLLRPALRVGRAQAGALVAAAAVVVGIGLALASDGFVARHAAVRNSSALGRDMIGWFAAQPWFDEGDGEISFVARSVLAPLAGDHFSHRLVLLPPTASCRRVRAAAAQTPLVFTDPGFLKGFLGVRGFTTPTCVAARKSTYDDGLFRVIAP
jgi:hypothetical protein